MKFFHIIFGLLIGRIGFPFLFQKIGVFLSERFDRGELFDSQFVKMILRCLVPPVYAFRALKVHGNQGFFRMAGRQVDKVILFPAKRGSKCGKKDKKEAPDAEALIPLRPALFQPIS